jgi:hypothetical protein
MRDRLTAADKCRSFPELKPTDMEMVVVRCTNLPKEAVCSTGHGMAATVHETNDGVHNLPPPFSPRWITLHV